MASGRELALLAIGLVFGGGLGFATAAGMGVTFDGHDHGDPAAHAAGGGDAAHDAMHDQPMDLPATDAPEVSMDLAADPVTGWNLHVRTRNFTFAPQDAGAENVAGEGHAHVYVNGTKIARLYGEWMHIDSLPEGEVLVSVTLNANDHRPLAVAGQPITTETRLIVE
jgi:hypothetical protein